MFDINIERQTEEPQHTGADLTSLPIEVKSSQLNEREKKIPETIYAKVVRKEDSGNLGKMLRCESDSPSITKIFHDMIIMIFILWMTKLDSKIFN